MSHNFELDKNKIDFYLNEVAGELKKLKCSTKIEIILIGGSSIIINYDFRPTSNDIDAFYQTDILKQAINNVGDKHNLPNGWLNKDFINTSSFSMNIIRFSTFYKEFKHILCVRTVTREYLIAMKLKAFRKYKHDISDIVGILSQDKRISLTEIKRAVEDLYGTYSAISEEAQSFISNALSTNDLNSLLQKTEKEELVNKNKYLKKRN